MTPTPTTFAAGLRAPEGPAFDRDGNLFVTEMEGQVVQRIAPDGTMTPFVRTGGIPNGLAFHENGDLYVTEAGLGAVLRVPPDGRPYMFADEGDEPFRNPNDLVFDLDGGLYLTDPVKDSTAADGRVYYVTPDGDVRLFTDGLRFPNGLALTPDGERLNVGETRTGGIHEFVLDGPGRFSDRRVRARVTEPTERGGPDGMAFTEDGLLYIALAHHGAILVLDEDDRAAARLDPGGSLPTNLAFGGPDRQTLFITEVETGTVQTLDTPHRGAALFGEGAST